METIIRYYYSTEREIGMPTKYCYNYDSGEYEEIDRSGYSYTKGEYVYNWDDGAYRREEEEERRRQEEEEENRRRQEEERW